MKNAYSTYQTANVDTADQGKLIIIAYDIAIKNCRMALEKFGNRKLIEERTKHLHKVQDAVGELMAALKLDVGEFAHRLYSLYDYILRRLVQANVKSEPKCVEEVLGYLVDLRSAWQEAIKKLKEEKIEDSSEESKSIAVTG